MLLHLVSLLLVVGCRIELIDRLTDRLVPIGESLLELAFGELTGRGDQGRHVSDEDVEFAVGVDVIDPDSRAACGSIEILIAQDLPVFELRAVFDQRSKGLQSRWLPQPGAILRPLYPTLARSAQQVEVAIAVPVNHEGVAVIPLDFQGLTTGLDLLRDRRELAFSLPLEEVERAGEVTDDEIEVPVAIPVDREGPGANVLRISGR